MKLYNIVVLVFFVIMSKANAQNKDFNSEYIKLSLDVEITDSNKKKLKLKKIFYHKSKYIVNFWATWCLPCKKELPELVKIDKMLKEKNKNINIIIISIDNKKIDEQILFLEKIGVSNLVSFYDKNLKFFNQLKLRGIPTTLLISSNNIIGKKEGIITANDKIFSEIIATLN